MFIAVCSTGYSELRKVEGNDDHSWYDIRDNWNICFNLPGEWHLFKNYLGQMYDFINNEKDWGDAFAEVRHTIETLDITTQGTGALTIASDIAGWSAAHGISFLLRLRLKIRWKHLFGTQSDFWECLGMFFSKCFVQLYDRYCCIHEGKLFDKG